MENLNNQAVGAKPGITDRTVAYSLRILKFYRELRKEEVGRTIGRQLLRAATSIGANVHEAQGAQSRADFIAKMSIAHKEALETDYWLRLLEEEHFLWEETVSQLREETRQLIKILA